MRSEVLYLRDIIDAIDAIARFLESLTEEEFRSHEMAQSAVLQKLTLIGEAAARLSKEFQARHPEVEWWPIIGFRNITVHEYFAIDLSIVWSTATNDIPELREQIAKILKKQTD